MQTVCYNGQSRAGLRLCAALGPRNIFSMVMQSLQGSRARWPSSDSLCCHPVGLIGFAVAILLGQHRSRSYVLSGLPQVEKDT